MLKDNAYLLSATKEELINHIKNQLLSNVVNTSEGPFLRAGAHQFQSLWTRDFCWAALGLLSVGEVEVVKNHAEFLLRRLNKKGLLPRLIDAQSSALTVLLNTLFRFLPSTWRRVDYQHKKLRCEYKGEHGTLAIDSNFLLILLMLEADQKGFHELLNCNKEALLRAYNFYEGLADEGLIVQPIYSDWQDSVQREGKSLYVNMLYWRATDLLLKIGWLDEQKHSSVEIRNRLQEVFYCHQTGLLKSYEKANVFSLDGWGMVLLYDFYSQEDAHQFYARLKKHPLWKSFGYGLCSYPNYAREKVSWTTKMVGLRHYHDHMSWSWLIGWQLAIAKKMQDIEEEQNILQHLSVLLKAKNDLYEIYEPLAIKPFCHWTYAAEYPFSWGLGVCLWALLQ